VIAEQIALVIETYTADSNLLLENPTDPKGFTDVLTADKMLFQDTTNLTADNSCLDDVRIAFVNTWVGEAGASTQTDATRGEKAIYDAAVELCISKMGDQITEATAEINAKITDYTNEADKQENKAKETFLRLIESSMIKLHGLTDLTATEVVELKDAIIA
jgi:hypothetical protein